MQRTRSIALASLLLGTCLATTCTVTDAVALAPSPAMPSDSISRFSFALVERLAARHGLTAWRPSNSSTKGWPECFSRETFHLCGKLKDGEVHWRMYQARTTRFTLWADSIRRELRDSLGAKFGVGGVRDCQWRLERDDAKSGCPVRSSSTSR